MPRASTTGGSGPGSRRTGRPRWTRSSRAIGLRSAFPDAWNELGYALRHQGRYGESLDAYYEALRLRPNFPEALEYLGEAYVKMGRLEDAHRVLDRLRALDPDRAQELAQVIERGPAGSR